MIEIGIHKVTKNYGFKNVLQGISFEVMTGERAAIVGANGCGKSTLFRIISGEEQPDSGSFSIRKEAAIGYLEQIPKIQETTTTVRQVLRASFSRLLELEARLRELEADMANTADTDALDRMFREYERVQNRFISMDGYAMEEEFSKIVSGFRLSELLELPFQVLSGGQKTVVTLAAAILKRPDILLLDEPTNHLDMETLDWFEGFLQKYRGTVLIISHDRYFLDRVAQKTIMIDKGTCQVFHGNYTFSLEEQERLLLQEFEQYKNQQKKIEEMKKAIKRFRQWGLEGDNAKFFRKAKELEKRLEKMEVMDRPQVEKPSVSVQFEGERSGEEVIRLKQFSFGFEERQLFQNVDLMIRKKEKVCLLGSNGSGKTSLIRCLLGEQDGYGGEIKIGNSVKIGYISQEIRFPSDKMTVLEAFRDGYSCLEGEARNILAHYFFTGSNVFKRVSTLSGGEKVLLKLAILIQSQMNFLVLDEPTNHIDIQMREILEEALQNFTGTILFVSHDRYFIQKIGNRIIEIRDKTILNFQGDFESYQRSAFYN